ncbi:MAG: glycosyltransferase [Caulobacteraceae bacterium]|nr:glycosyltransferase [Caulobacteraceae bacterium]
MRLGLGGSRGPKATTQVRRFRPRTAEAADVSAFDGARRSITSGQSAVLALTLFAVGVGLATETAATWRWLHVIFFTGFSLVILLRLAAVLLPRRRRPWTPLPDEALPRYTILAPLYQEAGVIEELVAALDRIDYPRDRLQALIVLEADDWDTRAAFEQLTPPPFIQLLIAPPGRPRTKPRACNIALEQATGEFLVIYDAEDHPEPLQLREAAARFAAGEARLACLQAPLRVYPRSAFLPRQFGLEYAVQFEVILPALARLGLPFPLGGTSNHFRVETLRAVGGWDAFNVTEDADLGFRLARAGATLGMLETPTWEPPPKSFFVWLPQRTRWIKGFGQTIGVHTRRPFAAGFRALASLFVTVGVAVTSAVLHAPVMAWVAAKLAVAAAGWRPPAIGAPDAALLLCGWVVALLAMMVGAARAGLPLRQRDLALAPLYWPLLSVAAMHALWQLAKRPYHWDKTPHEAQTRRAAA